MGKLYAALGKSLCKSLWNYYGESRKKKEKRRRREKKEKKGQTRKRDKPF